MTLSLMNFFFSLLLLPLVVHCKNNDDDKYGWSVSHAYTVISLNGFCIILILSSSIHFIRQLMRDNSKYPMNKWLITLQILQTTLALATCICYTFFKTNLFVTINSDKFCNIIYIVSLFCWAICRYLCVLSFIFRIYLSFRGSVLAYNSYILMLMAAFATFLCISVLISLYFLNESYIYVANTNTNTELLICITTRASISGLSIQLIDSILCIFDSVFVTIFLLLFIFKVIKLKTMNRASEMNEFDEYNTNNNNCNCNPYDDEFGHYSGGYRPRSYTDSMDINDEIEKEKQISNISNTGTSTSNPKIETQRNHRSIELPQFDYFDILPPTYENNAYDQCSVTPNSDINIIATENNESRSRTRSVNVNAKEIIIHQEILKNMTKPKDLPKKTSKIKYVDNTMEYRYKHKQKQKQKQKPFQLDELEKLMIKQTVLIFIIMISSWIVAGCMFIQPSFIYLFGINCCINVLCSWLVIKYTNNIWLSCINYIRCYYCYGLCWNHFGCFLWDMNNGCYDCRVCCSNTMQQIATYLNNNNDDDNTEIQV